RCCRSVAQLVKVPGSRRRRMTTSAVPPPIRPRPRATRPAAAGPVTGSWPPAGDVVTAPGEGGDTGGEVVGGGGEVVVGGGVLGEAGGVVSETHGLTQNTLCFSVHSG